jgi:NitT/TauT family transport system substrate-binding protein
MKRANQRLLLRPWLAFLLGVALVASSASAWAEKKTVFGYSWVLAPQTIPYYVSRDKGFWKDEGLNVKILRGYGSGDAIKRLNAGATDIADADAGTMIIARSKGAKVKEVFMRAMTTMHAIWSLKSSGISKPKDLIGRSVASSAGASTRVVFPAFAEVNGFKGSDVKWTTVTPAAIHPSVLSGKADAGVFYTIDVPMLKANARKVGKKPSFIFFTDHGLNMYGNGIIASDKSMARNPKFVKAFVRGIARGIAYSVDHPEEATDIYLKSHPEVNRKSARGSWAVHINHIVTDEARKHGYGFMTQETMTKTRDLMVRFYGIKNVMPVEDLYTNKFNPRIFPKK